MSSFIRDRAASTPEMIEAFGDASLLRAALAFEAALAEAQASLGLVEPSSAAAISQACRQGAFDTEALAKAAAHAGTLAIPLVADLRARVAAAEPVAARWVHFGATSQDLADTALILQAKQGMALLRRDLAPLRNHLAELTKAQASTRMIGRTLLQPALPISLGLKIVHWLSGVDMAAERLEREALLALALQFGGAVGTRKGLEGKGAHIAASMARALGLADPPLPWHGERDRIAGLGTALAILTGALGKIARDIALMAQGEVGEAFEPHLDGRGGSSAMAHKRNPTGCQVALSAALRAPQLAATLIATLPSEHERGLGGWQAEGPVLAELFLLAHGALAALIPVIAGLELDPLAMAENLKAAKVGEDLGEAEGLIAAALAARTPT